MAHDLQTRQSMKKTTVVWHVNDIKVRHDTKNIFTSMTKWLKKTYERLFEYISGSIEISIVNTHNYLGTTLDFLAQGKVKITMIS